MWPYVNAYSLYVFLGGAALLIAALWWRSQRNSMTRRRALLPSHHDGSPNRGGRQPSEPPAELTRWQVEMYDTGRAMKGELDTKLAALQTLIRLAREESERLEAALERAWRLGLSEHRDALDAIEQLAEPADPSAELPRLPPLPRDGLLDLTALRQDVYGLADQGHTAATIAEYTGAAIGEIEFLLSLRNTRSARTPTIPLGKAESE